MVEQKPHGHPAEKPVDLMKWLVEQSTRPCDAVCDLFMGSGTTGEACALTGRSFIGMELDPGYFETAQKRIAEAQEQLRVVI